MRLPFLTWKYSRTSLIRSHYAWFSGTNIRNREHKKKMTQNSYISSLLFHAFPENMIFQQQCSVHCQTAIVRYVFWQLDAMQIRKGARRAWSRTVATCRSSFPAILARLSRVKVEAHTRFPIPVLVTVIACCTESYHCQPYCQMHLKLSVSQNVGCSAVGSLLPAFDRQ